MTTLTGEIGFEVLLTLQQMIASILVVAYHYLLTISANDLVKLKKHF